MAEVVSAIEIGLAITGILNGLYTYGTSVKNAKEDIRTLAQELLALKAALEHFDLHSRGDLPSSLRDEANEVLKLTSETLNGIQLRLERASTGRLRSAVERAKWPFQAGEVKKHIDTIERAKSWFVMVILRDSTEATSMVAAELKGLAKMVERDIMERKEAELVKQTAEMLKWLAPFDSRAQLEKAARGKTPGTGTWVLEKQFREWMQPGDAEKPFMWISGKSGSGKTVLFSSIVDEIRSVCAQDSPTTRFVGYHCCSLDEAASQHLPNILGSILSHVGASNPALLESVSQRRRSRSTTTHLVPQNDFTLEELTELLNTVALKVECLYVLVDAVNEAPGVRDVLVDTLEELCREQRNVRILVTCTGEPARMSDVVQYIPVKTVLVDSDIRLYVLHRLKTEKGFANLSPKIREHILDKITSDAEGMFRWAKLCLDRLVVLRTGRDIKDALADMPRTLDSTYTTILERIAPHDRSLARETLLWLCFSVRPLRLSELAEAVILRDGDDVIEDDARLTNNSVLLDICHGLVVRDGLLVTLAHDSVRSFLKGDHIKNSPASYFALDPDKAHAHIMSRCLTYLRLEAFASGPVATIVAYRARLSSHPLMSYVATSWPLHSEKFSLTTADEKLILDFFATKTQGRNGSSFDSWVQFLLGTTADLQTIRKTHPLYYAASFNMITILRILVQPDLGVDLEKKGGRFGSPPLYVAVWRGNLEAAEIMLKAGADPLAWDMDSTAYSLAASRGMVQLVKLMDDMLEERGRMPERKGRAFGYPLRTSKPQA